MTTTTLTAAKPRLHYFDMLKGVAIFMVVMGHVLTMCVREIDRSIVFKFIGQVHMPLFFFISGWFTFKMADGRLRLPKLGQRALQLLVPMVLMSSLWIWYYPHSGLQSPLNSTFDGLWFDTWKNGYWFTLSLFIIIAVYAATCPLLRMSRSVYADCGIALGVWAVLLCLYTFILPARVSNFLSLYQAVAYWPAFMLGVLGRKYREGFMAAVHNSWCQTAAMIVLAITLYVNCWYWEFGLDDTHTMYVGALLHVCLAVVLLNVFESWSNYAYAPDAPASRSRWARVWEYVGTQSLAIYLMHYFFLFPMASMRQWLTEVNLSFTPTVLFAAAWASVIVAIVLCVVKLLEPSKILSKLLLGK